MLELDKPKWLGDSLPYVCIAAGLFALFSSTHVATLVGGSVLIITGFYDWSVKRANRDKASLQRADNSAGTRTLSRRGKAIVPLQTPNTLQVVVIEDNAATIRLYQIRIAAWGFPVTLHSASNGYEGLVLVGEIEPDLLVCDLRMPGVNGVQVVRTLCERERYKDMTIVMATGLSATEIEAHGGLPERVTQLSKPIDFDRLREIAQARWARIIGQESGSSTA